MTDLVETLLGIDPGGPLGLLRRQRQPILQHSEGAYQELVLSPDPGGLSLDERAALALRVALIEGDTALAGHFRSLVQEAGLVAAAERFPAPAGPERLAVLLRYADLVAAEPERSSQADLDGLTGLGLSARDIVALTQLIAFVPYQTRLLAGLRLLQGEHAA